ncbi:hypothetical protein EVJ58_g3892 [Rhodofomes roseus]|uniref:Protein kinase domain-containing protein n=1 Tax=Rhodofomes roseus TaxID=34475 RepID=A0A4Y9YJ35_9APHY|nr:hypothetical protein EVJ58_g3892 [Rhodofomes roseus]
MDELPGLLCNPQPACVFKAAMDNDIDEGMVIKKCPSLAGLADNRSTCESGSTMSLTEDYANHAGSRRINASDFEVIRQVERRQTASWKGELVIGRKNDTARLYAIKVFRKTSLGADQGGYTYARTEQAALRSVTERAIPFAMHLCWSFQDEKALYLIMNYVASDLRTFVECHGVLALSDAAIYASQLVHGLMALHAIGIVHCNINPSSLFIENGYLVISDFGHAQIGMGDLAQHVRRANHGPCKGEVEQYQAPELLLEWSPHAVSDWWGFGLVFYYMLTAKHPFLDLHEMVASHPAIVINKILHGKLPKWLVEGDDGALEDLLRKCLERNPAHRLSGEGVKAHPFFSDMNWELSPTNTPLGSACPLGAIGYENPAYSANTRFTSDDADEVGGTITLLASSQDLTDVDDFSFTWEFVPCGYPRTGSDMDYRADQGDSQASCSGLACLDARHKSTHGCSSVDLDYGTVVPSEFGVCRPAASDARKYGTIRKFASLNFDLDTLDNVPASGRMNPMGASPSPCQPPRSTSTFTSPFTSTPGTMRNKLRKKARPETTPSSVSLQPPILDLPPGIEQIGHGIGYTRRADPVYSHLSFPTLAPRSCQAIFSREYFSGISPRHGRKKTGRKSNERYDRPEGRVSGMNEDNQSEDQMDAVMQEVYGPTWNLGSSTSDVAHTGGADPRAYLALVRTTVGLGIGETALDSTHERLPTIPAELSTLSPDSTLRLVSPSLRDLHNY